MNGILEFIKEVCEDLCISIPDSIVTDVIFCERKEWIGIEERSSA